MWQGDNRPKGSRPLRGAGATLSGDDALLGLSSHQDGHLEGGPRLCDLGTTVDSNTVRQATRESCEGGPPLQSHPNAAVEAGDGSAGVEVVRQSGKRLPVPRDSREGGGAARKPGIRSASLTPRPRGRARCRRRWTAVPRQRHESRSAVAPGRTSHPCRTLRAALEHRAPSGRGAA